MRQIITIATATFLAAAPVQAQEAEDDGFSLMEEGTRLLLEGLRKEVEPALRDLQGMAEGMEPALREFALQMGPALAEIISQIEDLSAYHPPEMLPNGDIIIRKKTPQEMLETPKEGEEIEI